MLDVPPKTSRPKGRPTGPKDCARPAREVARETAMLRNRMADATGDPAVAATHTPDTCVTPANIDIHSQEISNDWPRSLTIAIF